MSELLSFGAGVNSTALAILLVNEGWRAPIVFADTSCEWPETYCYMDYFAGDWLAPRGLSITRLGGEWRIPSKAMSLIDYCEGRHMIPVAAMRWCTTDYKTLPIARFAQRNGITTELLAISADESYRQPEKRRPLVDRGISREDCVKIIEGEGLEVPQKSSCWLCPFQRDSQWRELWHRHRDLFERAARLEEDVQRRSKKGWRATLDYAGKVTLRERQYRYEHQLSLLDDGDWDALLRYKPCLCGL